MRKRRVIIRGAGEVVRRYRKNHGMGVNQISRLLCWTQGKLSRIENNQRSLSYEQIKQIAQVLDEKPVAIFWRCIEYRLPDLFQYVVETGCITDLGPSPFTSKTENGYRNHRGIVNT